MFEVMGHIPEEARGIPDQSETIPDQLRSPEFQTEVSAEALAADINQIDSVVTEETGHSMFAEAQAAQATLDEESNNGFLQSIRDSRFYQKMVRLTVGASIFMSFALPARAEAGEAPDQDDAEETDKAEASFEKITKTAMDSYKDLLHPEVYKKLKQCVDEIIESDLPQPEKQQAVNELFDVVSGQSGESRADLEQDLERGHDTTMELHQTYLDAETEADELTALEKLAKFKVSSAKQQGANTPAGEITVNFRTYELSAEPSGDTAQYTFTDTQTGSSVSFEM